MSDPTSPGDHRKKRFARRLQVRFWNQGETHPKAAYTTNISASGMFISSATPLPSGSRVRIEVIHGTRSFMVEGVVVHAARVAPVLRQLKESGMGVRFLSVEDLMAELIPDISTEEPMQPREGAHKGEGKRAGTPPAAAPERKRVPGDDKPAPRVASGRSTVPRPALDDDPPAPRVADRTGQEPAARRDEPPAPTVKRPPPTLGAEHTARCSLEFASIEEARAAFERDFSKGGAFVSSSQPAKLHERLMVDLRLPEPIGRVVSFAARVVHLLPAAPGSGAPTGLGVEFSDPDRVVRELSALLDVE